MIHLEHKEDCAGHWAYRIVKKKERQTEREGNKEKTESYQQQKPKSRQRGKYEWE